MIVLFARLSFHCTVYSSHNYFLACSDERDKFISRVDLQFIYNVTIEPLQFLKPSLVHLQNDSGIVSIINIYFAEHQKHKWLQVIIVFKQILSAVKIKNKKISG